MAGKPNILLIMTDEHHPHMMGCEGHPIVRTPHMDSLAANGVLFERCYTPSPLCVPARMSFLSAKYPIHSECWTNACFLPSETPTFAHALGAAGYETTLAGRMHIVGPDQRHGFINRLVGDVCGGMLGGGVPALGDDFINDWVGMKLLAGPGRTGYQVFDEEVTDSAVSYLKNYSQSDPKAPFCMVVGYVLPHSPFICTEEDWEYYKDKADLPHIPEGYLENAHPTVRTWLSGRNDIAFANGTDDQIRWTRAAYYGIITHVDRLIGQLLSALHETGLDKDTLVIYTSDHGEFAGEHCLYGKMHYFESAASVPLIMSWPGHLPQGRRLPQICNLVDIAPTLIDIAGGPELPDIDGRSLLPILQGQTDWVDETYSEFCPVFNLPPSRMIRRGNYKLMYFEGFEPLLFNVEEDPDEFNDLAALPEYAVLKAELLAKLKKDWSAQYMLDKLTRHSEGWGPIIAHYNATHPQNTDLWAAPPGTNTYTDWATKTKREW